MKFGVSLLPNIAIEQLIQIAQLAEAQNLEYVWMPDEVPSYPYKDPHVILTAIGNKTKKLKLGTGICVPYTRHPALLAFAMKTMDELFPNRMILGLGPGGILTLKPLGIEMWDHPIQTLSEAIHICRRLFTGQKVNYEGKIFNLYDSQLYSSPSSSIPIFIAARGPKMLELAGAFADGVLTNVPLPAMGWAMSQIEAGAKKTHRQLKNFIFANSLPLMITSDPQKIRKTLGQELLFTITSMNPSLHQHTNVSLDLIQRIIHHRAKNPINLLTDELIDTYAIAGSSDVVKERFAQFEAKGVSLYNFFIQDIKELQFLGEHLLDTNKKFTHK